MKRIVVIPSEAVSEYERAGYSSWLPDYYNPLGMFDDVVVLSPLEQDPRQAHGLNIRPVSWTGFAGALKELRPAIVRAYGGGWAAELACSSRVTGIPVVVSLHDSLEGSISPLVAFADRILHVSCIVRQQAVLKGVPEDRLAYLPNRVDRSIFHPLDVKAPPPGTSFEAGRHILHVGRQCHQKNPDTLIRALANLPTEYRAVFIGRGDTTSYRLLAAREGVEARCCWIPSVPNSELVNWYNWCSCMCTPSRHEGFGIVFIEAAACGVPIVTSDIAPMNEYLTHGTSAHLVPEYESPPAIAAAIRQVCEKESYGHALGQAAMEMSVQFDRNRVEQQENAIYLATSRQSARIFDSGELSLAHRLGRIALRQFIYRRLRARFGAIMRRCTGRHPVTA